MIKQVGFAMLLLFGAGCGMSDQEVRERTGDAAVAVKRAADGAGVKAKEAYDAAAIKGREAMQDAGAKLSDAALRAKVLAGFGLVAGLDAGNVEVEVRQGKVFLSGTVPTQLDKMKAEGVAYGVTGSTSSYESTIAVESK
jgi:osmotically-inducible protein OsmY